MKKYLFFSTFMCFHLFAMSRQINDPGLPGEDPDVPLDSWMIVLLIVAAAYGLKKINLKQ